MIRVLQFADIVNRHDFIDTIVQRADPARFHVGVCVRSTRANIAEPVYEARTPRWVLAGESRKELPRAVVQLARILREFQADVLHAHHFDQMVIGWLATRLYPRARLVLGRHYSDSIYRSTRGAKRRALLALEQAVNRGAARIIAPSAYIREILVEQQGVPAGKIDLVPYGFVTEKYRPPDAETVARVRAELGLEGAFAVGNFARLHEEKGQRFLVEAVARLRAGLPQLRVVIVGEGPERTALERQIEAAGLRETVRLAGWRRDAMDVMAAVDVVTQPTLQEAFSQVMVEALWMRKPLLITDVSGAPDIITDGQNGLLVPKGDAPALEQALRRLAGDPALRERLGNAGRAYVEEHLTVERVMPRYEQVFEKALAG